MILGDKFFFKNLVFTRIAKHVESKINLARDPIHGIVVTKKYNLDVDCIKWLNNQLSKYYDSTKGLPVAQHEFAALELLATYNIAPKPLYLLPDAIVMKYAGIPITLKPKILFEGYIEQCHVILETFKKLNFRHNDLLPRNVLVEKHKVKIIDFTLSEFHNINIISELPDNKWANPGQDENILNYLDYQHITESHRSKFINRIKKILFNFCMKE